ncbi:MAG: hypothetical protein M3Q58_09685 [Bacteroidota bacterium]|nr:hypothetical protein [Bacteroidota bacterium]
MEDIFFIGLQKSLHFSTHAKKKIKFLGLAKIKSRDYIVDMHSDTDRQTTGGNSTYKKLAGKWLNEALCFVSSFVVADSSVLRNRQLLVAANRCPPALGSAHFF